MSKTMDRFRKRTGVTPRKPEKHPKRGSKKNQAPNVKTKPPAPRETRSRKCPNCSRTDERDKLNWGRDYFDAKTMKKHSVSRFTSHKGSHTWICFVCGTAYRKKATRDWHETTCRGYFV